ncbi:MAG: lysophospholipid acyltransferase family protein [Maricaulaceae bacterium]|nr:lysophospholipid acyltransferase family protein [Maricaulaceae bacterium]
MLKRLLSWPPFQVLLSAILAGYMTLVRRTTRWEKRGAQHVEALWGTGEGVIYNFWHGRIILSPCGWPPERRDTQPLMVLISRSREGDIVAGLGRFLNFDVARGSSFDAKKGRDKGALAAFRDLVRHVRGGGCAAITPDGPRGPRMRVEVGAAMLAKTTGAPLIGFAWSTRWRKTFNSWDRFVMPFPFGRGVLVWTEPVHVARDASPEAVEAARQELERRMVAAVQEADQACGGPVIEPAAPRPKTAAVETAA